MGDGPGIYNTWSNQTKAQYQLQRKIKSRFQRYSPRKAESIATSSADVSDVAARNTLGQHDNCYTSLEIELKVSVSLLGYAVNSCSLWISPRGGHIIHIEQGVICIPVTQANPVTQCTSKISLICEFIHLPTKFSHLHTRSWVLHVQELLAQRHAQFLGSCKFYSQVKNREMT